MGMGVVKNTKGRGCLLGTSFVFITGIQRGGDTTKPVQHQQSTQT